MEHTWEIETIDGGTVGDADFWICHRCGASGGPVDTIDPLQWVDCAHIVGVQVAMLYRKPTPFLAGPALPLPEDCDEAKLVVDNYRSQDGL